MKEEGILGHKSTVKSTFHERDRWSVESKTEVHHVQHSKPEKARHSQERGEEWTTQPTRETANKVTGNTEYLSISPWSVNDLNSLRATSLSAPLVEILGPNICCFQKNTSLVKIPIDCVKGQKTWTELKPSWYRHSHSWQSRRQAKISQKR